MAQFPRDQFDDVPRDVQRVGAHRAAVPPARRWTGFAWAALACVVLVLAGVTGLSVLNGTFPFAQETSDPVATPTATPTAEPVTDPTTIDPNLQLTITVLNGSPIEGLHDHVGEVLLGQQWPVGARNNASARDVPETVVYYNAPEFEGIARGVLQALGGIGDVRFSDVYQGAPVTVVLGADYPDPGAA